MRLSNLPQVENGSRIDTCPWCARDKACVYGMTLCPIHNIPAFKAVANNIKIENGRAMKLGLTADLTLRQYWVAIDWFVTEDEFDNLLLSCAYCSQHLPLGIDHWLPLSHGGGTTANNCLPCCWQCNMSKLAMTGDEYFNFLIERYKSPIAERNYDLAKQYFEAINGSKMDLIRGLVLRDTS